ncbi:hypothetical protein Phum_PHUM610110 [Pediculus humanus corporis]|uniref:Uncharacterized protein n=1 Tax=Pediculus humanus subsp. corporis TaxID=121224 RepID=E0W3T4_PEDHC|nr:uncharacterized protein Phum_PHUM610110 [Pediculus humanus corporis]EEB20290.1 hypothetical protein Phum_PHUM610110 [Pediculus humanus corporis]
MILVTTEGNTVVSPIIRSKSFEINNLGDRKQMKPDVNFTVVEKRKETKTELEPASSMLYNLRRKEIDNDNDDGGEEEEENMRKPFKSYIIYHQHPYKIFKEWIPNDDTSKDIINNNNNKEKIQILPDFQNDNAQYGGQTYNPNSKSELTYQSVYSNVIKVFDRAEKNIDNRFSSGDNFPYKNNEYFYADFNKKPQFETVDFEKFPLSLPPNGNIFIDEHSSVINYDPPYFLPNFYFNNDDDDAEVISETRFNTNNRNKNLICGFIRVNNRRFPENGGGPCGRNENVIPLTPQDYPDHSQLPVDKLPVEHRHPNSRFQIIKRSGLYDVRRKRAASFGFGYDSWNLPYGYQGGYRYYNDLIPSRTSTYSNSRNLDYKNNNNKYGSESNYNDYDDKQQQQQQQQHQQQQHENYFSKSLANYLSNGGRRRNNNRRNNNSGNRNGNGYRYDNNDNNGYFTSYNGYGGGKYNGYGSNSGSNRGYDSFMNSNNYGSYGNNRGYDSLSYGSYGTNNRGYDNNNNYGSYGSGGGGSGGSRYNNNNYGSYGSGGSRYDNNNYYGSSRGYGNSGYGSSSRGYGNSGYGSNRGGYGSSSYGSYGNNDRYNNNYGSNGGYSYSGSNFGYYGQNDF